MICLLITSAQAWSFNDIFGSNNHRHKKKSSTTDNSASLFQQYCQKQATPYGLHITCQMPNLVTNFKANASATIRCNQQYWGTNTNYPNMVSLSEQFLFSLNQCSGTIYGPAIVKNTIVMPESNNALTQNNSLTTNYDIVCDSKAGFESQQYENQQQTIIANINNKIQACQNSIKAPSAQNFIYAFYIFLAIAFIAFSIIFWQYYRKKNAGK